MPREITAQQLSDRLRIEGVHTSPVQVAGFLREWQRAGIVEQDEAGRYRLTPRGRRRFALVREIGGRS